MTAARGFFEKIVSSSPPYQFLERLVSPTDPTFETEWLDFKGNVQPNDLRRLWSRALSGFANTQGGVLIFGIDARKDDKTEIDAASALSLIPRPHALKSRLLELHHQATDPPVLGVEIEAYEDANQNGFVVCYIPKSKHRPHRSEHCNKQYYIRAGDDHVEAGPSLLKLLFYPEWDTSLAVEIKLTIGSDHLAFQPTRDFPLGRCDIRLHVSGNAPARDVFVQLESNAPLDLMNRVASDWNFKGSVYNVSSFVSQRPIHPKECVLVVNNGLIRSLGHWRTRGTERPVPVFDPITLKVIVYATGLGQQFFSAEFSDDEFADIAPVTKLLLPA
jgi:hypothetical protein